MIEAMGAEEDLRGTLAWCYLDQKQSRHMVAWHSFANIGTDRRYHPYCHTIR